NRPGGNVTGAVTMNAELGAKRLGLLHELVPAASRFAALVNPSNPFTDLVIKDAQVAAGGMGLPIEIFAATNNRDINIVFASLVQKRIDALLVAPEGLFVNRRAQLFNVGGAPRTPHDLSQPRIRRSRWPNYL